MVFPTFLAAGPDPLVALLIGFALAACGTLLFWPNGGFLGRRQRLRMLSSRVLREDALKAICSAELEDQPSTAQSVAGALELPANQVAEILGDLEDRDLVTFEENQLRLTPSGRDYALHIVRTHRLWERYLADRTGLSAGEWHKQADRLEHYVSPSEASDLSTRLGNPSHDPHGDPIPTESGEMARSQGKPLTDAAAETPLRIVHIEDEPEVVYTQLVAEGLYPGMLLRVLEKTPQRVRFWSEGEEHVLAPRLAANISVTQVPESHVPDFPSAVRLSTLRPGQRARVLGLSRACRGAERRRLLDLGFVPGTVVRAEMVSPVGDPVAYRVRGTLIGLRAEQAGMIQVADLEEVAA